MRYVMGMVSLVMTALVAGPLAAQPAEPGPAGGATAFYVTYLKLPHGGVPDARQRAQLKPLVSPALHDLLAAADRAEERYATKTKKQVPPLVEGDLFTSLFEGATRFAVTSCTGAAARAVCQVDFGYKDSRGGAETTWHDRVHMVKGPAGWLVDDIEYAGSWPFARRGKLSDGLKAVVRDADK
ncbi:MAG: DUF3828 domain-containing protein [Alphaproteobacteria bacterium]|nr:DUF3828 domain-containing protein [Alphaproteobacteria bacterium]